MKLKVQFYTQRKRFEECAQNLTFHVGGAKASLWLLRSRKFVFQNVGGSEWVRSQNQLCAWRCKDWHALHESSYCYFSVYAGTRNLNEVLHVICINPMTIFREGFSMQNTKRVGTWLVWISLLSSHALQW